MAGWLRGWVAEWFGGWADACGCAGCLDGYVGGGSRQATFRPHMVNHIMAILWLYMVAYGKSSYKHVLVVMPWLF